MADGTPIHRAGQVLLKIGEGWRLVHDGNRQWIAQRKAGRKWIGKKFARSQIGLASILRHMGADATCLRAAALWGDYADWLSRIKMGVAQCLGSVLSNGPLLASSAR